MVTINIKTYPVQNFKSDIVRLQPDAADILRQHQRASGLSASYILSEIIRQTKDGVRFDS